MQKRYNLIYRMKFPDNSYYIGKTYEDLFEKRMAQHKNNSLNPNSDCYNWNVAKAIRKFGWDNIIIDTISSGHSIEDTPNIETFWIRYYKIYLGKKCHNMKDISEAHAVEPDIIFKRRSNKISTRNTSSKYLYVYLDKNAGRFRARVFNNYKFVYDKPFLKEKQAAKAADCYIINNNINAPLNFPDLKKEYLENPDKFYKKRFRVSKKKISEKKKKSMTGKRMKHKNSSSKYFGVWKDKKTNSYIAYYGGKGRTTFGSYSTAEEASKIADCVRVNIFNLSNDLNFSNEDYSDYKKYIKKPHILKKFEVFLEMKKKSL